MQRPEKSCFVEILFLDHRNLLRSILAESISNACSYFCTEIGDSKRIPELVISTQPDICILSIGADFSFIYIESLVNDIADALPDTPILLYYDLEERLFAKCKHLKNVRGYFDSKYNPKDVSMKIKSVIFN